MVQMHTDHGAKVDPADERYIIYRGRRMLRAAGGSPAAPVSYPLSGPTVSNNLVTVDEALNTPTRITRDIAALAQQNFFANRLFSDAGQVQGGAVLYETPNATATDLYASRGFQVVGPGEEGPELEFLRGVPAVAKPQKIMGKFKVPKEVRTRNDIRYLTRAMTQAANTIALTLDAMAMAVVNAAITANSRTGAGTSWGTAAGVTLTNTSGTNQAIADVLVTQSAFDLEERGKKLTGLIVHQNQNLSLSEAALLRNMSVEEMLSKAGITTYIVSQRVTAGTAILFDANNPPGGWATEFPLTQDTWYENKIESSWYQWSVTPAMFLDDYYGLWKLTGLA